MIPIHFSRCSIIMNANNLAKTAMSKRGFKKIKMDAL